MASHNSHPRAQKNQTLPIAFGAFKYIFTCPWDNFYRGVVAIAREPDQQIDIWIKKRNEENSFIGLVASVISATTAQLLANTQDLDNAPWTASAAYFISLSLSIVAVIMALHQTIFLNSMVFLPSPMERLRYLLGIQRNPEFQMDYDWRKRVWRGTFVYSLPQLVLTYSIFSLFVGLGLMNFSSLWSRAPHDEWKGPQKIAIATIVGVFLCIISFISTIAYQFTPASNLSSSGSAAP